VARFDQPIEQPMTVGKRARARRRADEAPHSGRSHAIKVAAGPVVFHCQIAAERPTQCPKRLLEDGEIGLPFWVVLGHVEQHGRPPSPAGLLCPSAQRPCRRTSKPRDKFPPPHLRPPEICRRAYSHPGRIGTGADGVVAHPSCPSPHVRLGVVVDKTAILGTGGGAAPIPLPDETTHERQTRRRGLDAEGDIRAHSALIPSSLMMGHHFLASAFRMASSASGVCRWRG
jgi:hypothetical protein